MRVVDNCENPVETRYSTDIVCLIAVIGYALVVMIVYGLHG